MASWTERKLSVIDLTVFAVTSITVVVGICIAVMPPAMTDSLSSPAAQSLPKQIDLLPISSETVAFRLRQDAFTAVDTGEIRNYFEQNPSELNRYCHSETQPSLAEIKNLFQVLKSSSVSFDGMIGHAPWRPLYWACRLSQQSMGQVLETVESDQQLCDLLHSAKLFEGKKRPQGFADLVLKIVRDPSSSEEKLSAAIPTRLSRREDRAKLAEYLTDLVFEHRCNDSTIPRLAGMDANLIPDSHRGRLIGEVLGYLATRDFSQPATSTEKAAEELFLKLQALVPEEKRQRAQQRFEKIRRPR